MHYILPENVQYKEVEAPKRFPLGKYPELPESVYAGRMKSYIAGWIRRIWMQL